MAARWGQRLVLVLVLAPWAFGQKDTGGQNLNKGQLRPQNRELLAAIGDRLEVSGKERLTLGGTLALGANGQAADSQIVLQWPDQLRVGLTGGGTTIYSGGSVLTASAVTKQDEDLTNSLILDSVDHYFLSQAQGAAVRPLGSARVLDVAFPSPTIWNLVQVLDQAQVQGVRTPVLKVYGFNSGTRLLENVAYTLKVQGTSVAVQTRFSNWQLVQQQWLPGKITRLENGVPTFTFVLTSATVSGKVADTTFTKP